MLLIHQLVGVAAAAAAEAQACGADVAPLSPKHDDTIESASVITAGLIGVSLLHRQQKTQRGGGETYTV